MNARVWVKMLTEISMIIYLIHRNSYAWCSTWRRIRSWYWQYWNIKTWES